MRYEFDSEIQTLDGKIKWNVIYFPYSTPEHFQERRNKDKPAERDDKPNWYVKDING